MKNENPRSKLQRLFDDIDREEEESEEKIVFSRVPKEKRVSLIKKK